MAERQNLDYTLKNKKDAGNTQTEKANEVVEPSLKTSAIETRQLLKIRTRKVGFVFDKLAILKERLSLSN